MYKDLKALKREARERYRQQKKENNSVRKIVGISLLVTFIIAVIVVFAVYRHISSALEPYNPQDTKMVEVEIPSGSTMKDVAQILAANKIVKDATVFSFYLKTKDVGSLQAGYYSFSPSMSLDTILEVIKAGGSSDHQVIERIVVVEGYTLEQVAEEIAQKTPFSKEEVLATAQNPEFLERLRATYPELLTAASQATDTRYMLEGYLFPATYQYRTNDTVESLLTAMVRKENEELSIYYEQIAKENLTVHQVLTLASLVEKEALPADAAAPEAEQFRRRVAGVFVNRLNANMPLQSDISVLYALNTHKELVTFEDLEVDSPYNLYQHTGYGPGPFNMPSADAIAATLNPIVGDDFYFLADVKTGLVYFAPTYEEHLKLVEQYIPESLSSQSSSAE